MPIKDLGINDRLKLVTVFDKRVWIIFATLVSIALASGMIHVY